MKVLLLNGSPRGEGSGTLQLARAFLDGLQSVCDAEIETVHLIEKKILPCRGCFGCWTKTPGRCVQRDDMDALLPLYRQAELVVWCLPLYYFGMPAHAKAFLDRLLPSNLPRMDPRPEGGMGHPPRWPELQRQRHLLVSTCGFCARQNNYEALEKQFELAFGGAEGRLTEILCPEGELFRVPQLRGRTGAYLGLLQKAGQEFGRGGIAADTRAALEELLFPPDVFIKMADASWEIAGEPEAESEALRFTRQMAALYDPESWPGKDLVLEMAYTDKGEAFQLRLGREEAAVCADKADFAPYTARVETPLQLWRQIGAGEADPMQALAEHRYRIFGDLSFMSRWDDFFSGGAAVPAAGEKRASPADARGESRKSPSFALLLLPWIVFSCAQSAGALAGAAVTLAACLLLLPAALRWQLTPFDAAEGVLLGAFSAAVLLLGDGWEPWLRALATLGYALLWLGTGLFARVPLTAWYSSREFGGRRAWANPLFLRTNRILTLVWGAYFLLSAALPLWAVRAGAAPLAMALAGQLAPLPLTAFTLWFQRWYPACAARGRDK